jgi:glycosyltransferase involved in cell wall biosynthesis
MFVSVPETDLLSISVLEGMACGCVPILADLPAYRTRIVDGENGFLFEPGNADDLISKIDGVQKMDLNALGEMKTNSLKRVKDHYTKETGYKNLVELFEKVLRGKMP